MRTRRSRLLPSAFLTMASLLLIAANAAAMTLKLATIAPGGSSWLQEMKHAADEIAKATDGRVKLKFYPGGVMGNDQTVLRKMRAGQLHGGAFPSGSLAEILPDVDLYSLPLMFRSYEEIEYVRERLDAELLAKLEEKGLIVLALSDNGFAYLMSTRPVREVGDLEGAKVWIPQGDVMSETALQAAGVSPVPLPLPDVYTGLQTGLIDTVAAPPIGAIAFQWHTKVKYLTDAPLMYLLGLLVVDAKAWRKIEPADREVVRERLAAAAARLDTANRVGERNAYEALETQGIETVEPSSAEELERWRDIGRKSMEELRAKGIYSNGRLDAIEKYVAEYRRLGADGNGKP